MHLLEDGMSFGHIHKKYGINEDRLKVLWARYQEKGLEGLHKSRNIKADSVLRKKIVIDIEENHLTLHAASLKYGASPQKIGVWLKIARTEGINSLSKNPNAGKMKGKMKDIFSKVCAKFKQMGTVVRENNGAAIIAMNNGCTALILKKM